MEGSAPQRSSSRAGDRPSSAHACSNAFVSARETRKAVRLADVLVQRAQVSGSSLVWEYPFAFGGTPWDGLEAIDRWNPARFARDMVTPMLVIHGGKDYRVVDTQGISTFNAAQRLGIPSKFLYFPDENHWVLKPANSILWHETVLEWLDRWTKGDKR